MCRYFPKREQGLALGLNAGVGNLGVSIVQLAVPLVMLNEGLGTYKIGGMYPQNAGWLWVILCAGALVTCARLLACDVAGGLLTFSHARSAWLSMNTMPKDGSISQVKNMLLWLRLQAIGYIAVLVGAVVQISVVTAGACPRAPAAARARSARNRRRRDRARVAAPHSDSHHHPVRLDRDVWHAVWDAAGDREQDQGSGRHAQGQAHVDHDGALHRDVWKVRACKLFVLFLCAPALVRVSATG